MGALQMPSNHSNAVTTLPPVVLECLTSIRRARSEKIIRIILKFYLEIDFIFFGKLKRVLFEK